MVKKQQKSAKTSVNVLQSFHLDFLTPAQRLAWNSYLKHDILLLLGPPGTGKTHLAVSFAIHDILKKFKSKIIFTRPIVESGENLGYLPGTFDEKVAPYMMPIYDAIDKLCGREGKQRESIERSYEICPLAFMRGRSFSDSILILDEAQNATKEQLKLAITRLDQGSKMIITADPDQSDLPVSGGLMEVVDKISSIQGVGKILFKESSIVRHPIVAKILKKI